MSMLAEALKYARKGRKVFPCGINKRPLTQNGFYSATTDDSEVLRMWSGDNVDALIGSPTGDGTVVIDVDGEDGMRSLASLEFAHGALPLTRTSLTGNGKHLWYRVDCEVRNSAGKLAPGVDVRGDGGYVILPNSPHPNGTNYTWARMGKVADLPEKWLALLKSDKPYVPTQANSAVPSQVFPAGQRNSGMTSLAGSLRTKGLSGEALRVALQVENKVRCQPPLPEREIDAIAKSVSRYKQGEVYLPKPATPANVASVFINGEHLPKVNGNRFSANSESRLILKCFKDIEPQDVKWLWPGVIPLGKLTMLVGDPGLGKSLITVDLAARLSKDGRLPDDYGPICSTLFLTSEDDEEDTLRPRLDRADADVSRVHIITMAVSNGQERMFNLKEDLQALGHAIEDTQSQLVVIDPVSAYLGGTDAHNNAEVRGALGPLSEVAKRHGCAIVAINHFRKSPGPAVQKAAMSMAFAAHARAVWGVARDRVEPETRLFMPIKANLGKDGTGWSYTLRDVDGVPVIDWGERKTVGNVDYLFNGPQGSQQEG